MLTGLGIALGLAGCAAHARPSRATATESRPTEPTGPERVITDEALRGPIRFLADDLLEGRGPGTRGDLLARNYVSSTMALLGLAPGSPDGSFEQPFDLLGVTTVAPSRWRFSGAQHVLELQSGNDFVAVAGTPTPQASFPLSDVVFVGYGIQAPEYQWDDFKGADLRGKVLLMLNDDPDWDPALFAGKRRLYYGRWTYKFESAARQGAVAAIVIHTDDSAGYPWQTVITSWSGENSRLTEGDDTSLAIRAWVTSDAAHRIAALGGYDLDALIASARSRSFTPVALGVDTALAVKNDLRSYRTANVLGLLRGSDPALRDQIVVLTAHHDHLGVKTLPNGERQIYNGAMDNASGVAELLSIARAFTTLDEAPRRSVLFLAVGAEEQGLLGSAYYALHPTVPTGKIAADLNIDGANLWGRTRDVRAVGYGKSSLDEIAAAAAAAQGRTYGDEEFPEKGSFYRSDQFSFAKIGVPAIDLGSGIDYVGRPPGWGREQVEGWIAHHYHQPSDDYDPSWDLSGMVEDARLEFAIAREIADRPEMPTWKPGDEFEATRKRAN